MKVKEGIIRYLQLDISAWVFGGELERVIGQQCQTKPSNVSRQLREMAKKGFLETQYVSNPNDKNNKVVQYRLFPLGIRIQQSTLFD